MRALEIFVAKESPAASDPAEVRSRGAAVLAPRRAAREILDVFVGGANVTARIADGQGVSVLRDLAFGIASLLDRPRGKTIARFYDEPWEICIERTGDRAWLSVYRTGKSPEVAVYDAPVPFADVYDAVTGALRGALRDQVAPHLVQDLERALSALHAPVPFGDEQDEPEPVSVDVERDTPISFAADFALRPSDGADAHGEHADLHGLLFHGRLRAQVRGREVELGEGHPFLWAERLLGLVRTAVDAFAHGRSLNVRDQASGVLVGVRLDPSGSAQLQLAPARAQAFVHTFPELSIDDLAFAAVAFGRALVRAVLRRDRGQANNVRLASFRRELRALDDSIRDACRGDARTNPEPESYRMFSVRTPADAAPTAGPARLRYTSRWRALVPGIDLRGTFLCGDRLVVSASQETFCLDRASGEVHWRVPTRRASSVVTPMGIARLHADGELALLDFESGEARLRTRLAPRTGGPPAGAVVNLPGLPRLIIVAEGERHLVAVDLRTGEARWRHACSKGGALRLKRNGKLLYVASGDAALSALDVQSGRLVWRVCDRLRFLGAPTVDHDAVFAVAGGASGVTRLYAIDPFSGAVRYAAPVPGPDSTGELHLRADVAASVEGGPIASGEIVALALRDRAGVRLAGFDRATGELRWTSNATVASSGTSWLAVDDVFVGNSPTGELVGVDAATGTLRYRHVLGRALEADVPRRLEPVLRGGALFVPHTEVHVFRPKDGGRIATVEPCEAIPDLLRVDERYDVFVAEESGHMACFGVASRLALVR
jgi:outer membrane protein assembly factor BamB